MRLAYFQLGKDPIGIDAVIQWPGGLKMQLYWHFTPPKYASMETIPDNRVYVSRDRADEFVDSSYVSPTTPKC